MNFFKSWKKLCSHVTTTTASLPTPNGLRHVLPSVRQPPTVFSSIVCPVPSVTDESLHRVSSSRESAALLVKGINQQKSQQESLQTLLQSLRASQYWQQLQKQREVIPEGFDTPFHQHSHERMLFSSSKCHFNAATVQTLIGIHNLLKCLLTNKKPRLL